MYKRKLNLLTMLVVLCISSNNYAQKSSIRKDKYSVGIGYGFNSNVGNDGLVFSNDYKYYLSNRLALNPALSYFQSINLFHDFEEGYQSHSGLVLSFSLDYTIYHKNDFNIALNLGPSFEIGDQSHTWMRTYYDGILTEERFENERLFVPGVVGNVEFSWDESKKFVKSISIISNSQYGLIPNSLGIVYKIGF